MIAVFGGSFNPPTYMHLKIARDILRYGETDRVIFLPTGDCYDKPDLADAQKRMEMLKICIRGYDGMEVSDIDIAEGEYKGTIYALEKIQEMHPHEDIAFVMGTDNLKEMKTWVRWQELVENFKFIVVPRDRDKAEDILASDSFLSAYRSRFLISQIGRMNISSTALRNILAQGGIPEHIHPEVYRYIKENELYETRMEVPV